MAGEQKRFARFFFYLRNLREAALHTGARAEEAEDRGLELLHSAETEAELKKLEEADSDTLSYVKRGLNRIAFGAVNDAVKLVFDAENMTARDIMGMDLFNVSEIKISGKNVLEIKFLTGRKPWKSLGSLRLSLTAAVSRSDLSRAFTAGMVIACENNKAVGKSEVCFQMVDGTGA